MAFQGENETEKWVIRMKKEKTLHGLMATAGLELYEIRDFYVCGFMLLYVLFSFLIALV